MDKKILIIRFSSFGDIVHTRSVCKVLKENVGVERIDWLLRSDLKGAIEGDQCIDNIFSFERSLGLWELIKMAKTLARNEYDLIYDAHNNLRSFFVRNTMSFFSGSFLIVRSKERLKRALLFGLGINLFPKPYKAMESYWAPLKSYFNSSADLKPIEWSVPVEDSYKELVKDSIVLVPSTAWAMKSWPQSHWEKLVEILDTQKFIILGGPEDKFCSEIESIDPSRVTNLAGKLTLAQSCSIAAHAKFLISADTGLQQVADLAGVDGLSLMGPSAFGFTTMGKMKTLETDLKCRPCSKDGRGKCSQDIFQKCMVQITPEKVASEVNKFLSK